MSNAPHFDIDIASFWADPYPDLARMRREAPIAFVPQLGSTVFTRRDDIFRQEKRIEVFSSHQPAGLMNTLMGHNMMRKDGEAHMAERAAMFPAVSPRAVRDTWSRQFKAHADRILEALAPAGQADLCKAFALPLSAECLKDITGLTNMRFADMDAWSQAMIDGIANYTGNKEVEARCHAATAGIDAAIDDMIPVVTKHPDHSILGVLLAAGMNIDSVRANIKLAISGGQNEPRDAISGTVWALLTHPDQLATACRQTLVVCRRRFRAGGSRVLHVRLGQPRRGLFRKPRLLRHHPRHPEEHRLRRRPALLRRRLCVARDGRRRGAARHLCSTEGLAARPARAGQDRRLGVSRAIESAGAVGSRLDHGYGRGGRRPYLSDAGTLRRVGGRVSAGRGVKRLRTARSE
jgi:hypothetical protein